MRALWLILACAVNAPTPAPRAEAPAEPAHLGSGQTLVVQLDRGLSTDKTKAGEVFTARVVTSVRGLPADARVAGTVAEVRRGSDEEQPILRLRVDQLVRGRCRLPLRARVASAEVEPTARPKGDAYRGAAIIGAVTGGFMGLAPGALIGFGVGMTAGAVKEARSLHEDARLAEGALLQLQLTSPLDVRACSA